MKREEENKRGFGRVLSGNFMELPPWMKLLTVSVGILILLTAGFFLTGSYLYSPQKTARAYYEAKLAGDWNRMYDCCQFPEGKFLSRKNFVNAMSYEEQELETPKIKSYRMKKTGTDGTTGNSIYSLTCTLEGISEVQKETVKIAKGEKVLGPFYEWYIVPEDLYVENAELAVPEDAQLYLDGLQITDQYEMKSEEDLQGVAVYRIPYLFLGYHTIQIQEKGRDEYREIIRVKDNKRQEILPELKLNDANGKKIADLAEDAVQDFCEAGMKKQSFDRISKYFLNDTSVRKKAEKAFESFSKKVADEENTGLVRLAVTGIETSVSNSDGSMKAEVKVSYTAEKVEKKLFFFYRTVTESGSRKISLLMKNSQGEWKIQDWS